MTTPSIQATYIGGPTALIEFDGIRLLTDPTFDLAGQIYQSPASTLRKLYNPAVAPDRLGHIDAILLSHDHHFDNLDRAGRDLLPQAGKVFTTVAGAVRLGGNAVGLAPWRSVEITGSDESRLCITGTPARHGPAGGDRGPVTGFLITNEEPTAGAPAIYVSGDTVGYEALDELPLRADIRIAFLFMGAARVLQVGPDHLTLTAEEGVALAKKLPHASIVPLHYEGWEHFSEGRAEIDQAFARAGLDARLAWLEPGEPTTLAID